MVLLHDNYIVPALVLLALSLIKQNMSIYKSHYTVLLSSEMEGVGFEPTKA